MACGLCGMPGLNARSCPKVLVATAKSKDVSKESPVPLKKVAMAKDDEASAEPPGVLDQAKPPTFLDKVTTDPCGNAVPFMCDKVLPWVDHVLQQKIKRGDYEQNLPGVAAQLNNGSTLSALQPLKIRALQDSSSGMLTSYKPAFEHQAAMDSLQTNGVFEGPISLFALEAEPAQAGTAHALAGAQNINWKLLAELASAFDIVETVETEGSGGVARVARTMFPVILPISLDSRNDLSLLRKPVLVGHQWLLAWYLALYKQIEVGNDPEILRLLQCALTPTVQIRTGLSVQQQALWSTVGVWSKVSRLWRRVPSDLRF